MRVEKNSSVSVGFISLGCAKNLVDSQVMAGYLKHGGVALAPSPETADVILVNTCAFIEAAREEAADAILEACEYKREGGCRAVVVTGCMVQRYRERMQKAFPDVDAFLGVDELERVAEVVRQAAAGEPAGVVVARGEAHKVYTPLYPTLLFTGGPFAYLKIAEGCSHRCAYCAIPNIRGRFRSRGADELLEEARSMVAAGVKEINLIAQDSLRYGTDRKDGATLTGLLRRLDALEGEFWLRVLYGHPASVSDELLELLNGSRHVCRYLDLPVQHSHPDVLRAMNRGKAVDAILDLPQRLRQAVPGIVLRTTCLVGFPGETETHFEHLLEYVKQAKFDHLGVFVYSPEEETAAFEMADVPELEVAESRRERLMAAQRAIVDERARALAGGTDTVLLLHRTRGAWIGRLARQAPEVDGETRVTGVPSDARPGTFVPVRVTGGNGYDLKAQAI